MGKKKEIQPELWVEEHGDYLFRFAFARVSNKQVAEDLVQDTFLAAFHARNSFKGNSSVRTWLTAILRRKIIDFYRKRAVRAEEDLPDAPFQESGEMKGHWNPEYAPQEWRGNPEQAFQQREFFEVLQECLQHLSEKTRIAFILKEMEHMETEEICKELDISSSNYWVLMHRARLLLRSCLEKNWFTDRELRDQHES